LATWASIYARVEKLQSIPASQFMPVPKVDGGILRFTPHIWREQNPEFKPEIISRLERMLRLGFRQPRKTLWNNLRSIYGENLTTAWAEIGLKSTARAGELTLDNWLALVQHLDDTAKISA
jgi:16S rRNA A1518/A1519 N6-dimethyltransferase RsmA/KsgA/DIM1 with predicted DNA glycosylase/AP lyase activity